MDYGRTPGVQFKTGVRDFSLLHSIQTSTGDHQVSYPMSAEISFSSGKEAMTTYFHLVPRSTMVEQYFHSSLSSIN
jgi:hypothetical protein